ncbi:MAG: ABC transporter ATP-binding protein [Candidatus Rokubacteria bacterium]|nr:ABC transporter ATP-binding protein [Candidatus Rokubacteria bacterium]
MAGPVVALSEVRVTYDGVPVLDVPRFEAFEGEILAVIGPNGAGKSTLLRVVGLLEPPTRGEVRFRDRPVRAVTALAERRRMATVFQQPLLADMTVAENVALGLRFRGAGRRETEGRVGRWLERLGVAGLGDRRARTLSGGEAQRVALARALVLEPEVLLLDEPFAGLDEPTRAALIVDLGVILRADRATVILVTHDRNEAQALADRVAVMMRGRVEQVDETERVFRAPASEEVARFVGVETIVTGRVVAGSAGVTTVEVGSRRLEVAGTVEPGARVRVCLRPEDVTLMRPTERAPLSSARNHLDGTVAAVTPAPPHVRVVVDCGFSLVAVLTPRSVEDLGLAAGVPITAVFKASAVHLIRYPASLDTPQGPGL